MPSFSRAALLDLWDRGTNRHPLDRALLLLEASYPESTHAQLADWSIARRDEALLKLRCALFGPKLQSYLDCPQCRERLEFSLDGEDLFSNEGKLNENLVDAVGSKFRFPTSRDLAKLAEEKEPEKAVRRLAQLCLVDGPLEIPDWSEAQLTEIENRMSEADSRGDIRLDFHCSHCGHRWEEPLDIGGFLWEEIEAQAKKLLVEVHWLASAYGWSEKDILAMGDARRGTYLEWVTP